MNRLKRGLSALVALAFASASHGAQTLYKINPDGETHLTSKFAHLLVEVDIRTNSVDIGKPSDQIPDSRKNSCTYSRFPCSEISWISIVVNKKMLFVPRSAFCDLSDLNTARITESKYGFMLILAGGDASESFVAKMEFGPSGIRRRILESALLPGEPTQETTYFQHGIGF